MANAAGYGAIIVALAALCVAARKAANMGASEAEMQFEETPADEVTVLGLGR
jgi:hypothetical protein